MSQQGARCGHVDNQTARSQGLKNTLLAEIGFFHVFRKSNDGDDNLRILRRLRGRVSPFGPSRDQIIRLRLGPIIDRKRITGIQEMARHALSHNSDSNESDSWF